ncbi:hypothetical protein C7271_21925 [filamentous cyanobacterium CCP5]|nr:hypothetical protein C7271_21925 [filamentous cyanobacterium CCP5]
MTDEPTLPRGPGWGMTFLYYFSSTALVTTFLALKTLDVSLDTGIPNQLGLVAGLVGGSLGAYVNHNKTIEIPYKNSKGFLKRLEGILADMGYTQDPDVKADFNAYRRPLLRQLFSGRIYVQCLGDRAVIAGRSLQLKALKNRLDRPQA